MRVLTVATLAASSVALSAQAPPPQTTRAPGSDKASATAVVVDVVVRDGRGRPVVNLGPDDFEIYEDGVRQTLGSFRAPAAAATPAPATPEAAAPSALPTKAALPAKQVPREASVMAFVFDRLNIESRKIALDAVRRYVGDAVQTPNIVGVFDLDDFELTMLQPFTQDGEAIRESLKKVTASRPTAVEPGHVTDMRGLMEQGLAGGPSSGRPADDLTVSVRDLFRTLQRGGQFGQFERDYQGRRSMTGFAAVVGGLGRAPGRKSIVLFTDGIPLTRNTDVYMHALIDQANRANVAMYTVDAAGLRAGSHNVLAGRFTAEATQDAAPGMGEVVTDVARLAPDVALGMLADATGGQMIESTNDVFRAFTRLDEDLRSYYGLTYAPPRAEPDGKFHKIVVKVKRPGLSAKTRSGYTSLPVGAGELPVLAYEAPALARLESSPLPNELPVLARAFVFPISHEIARVPVMVSLPSGALDYARDEATGTFSAEAVVLVRIRDAQGQVVHKASEQYAVSGKLENVEASRRQEMLFYRQPQLAPGVYTLEAIVQDSRTGKASVRISSLEVPRATASSLRIGTPFVVRRAERVPAAERDESNPLYFGDMLLYPNLGQPLSKATDKDLAFGFTAYDGHDGPVQATLELLRSGQPVATMPLTLSAADPQGRINQFSKLPLESLSPGTYELRVTIKAGSQQVTRGVPFAIAGT